MSDLDVMLPLHARTRLGLRRMLADLPIGSRISSERELCNHFRVSRVTIRRVLRDLAKEGLLDIRHGSGAYLIRKVEPAADQHDRLPMSVLGISVPSVENRFISRIVVGIEREAAAGGYGVMLSHDHGDPDLQIRQMQLLHEHGCAGLIAYPDGENVNRPAYVQAIRRLVNDGVAVVLLDRYVPGTDTPSVITDAFKGSYLATEHLIAAGRRRFALLRFGPGGGASDANRNRGFRMALKDYGLDETSVVEADLGISWHETKAHDVVARWWHERPGSFDAIVCMEDNMAFGAFLALREAGARVPDDVALVGFDNLDRPEYRDVGLRLTSVDQPAEDMGRHAVRLLVSQLQQTPVPAGQETSQARHVVLPPHLVIRDSCGVSATH